MCTDQIETVMSGQETLALIIRSGFSASGLHFLTPPEFPQQLAVMRHPQGKTIRRHTHNPVSRQIIQTQEVLMVRRGSVKVTLYNSGHELVAAPILEAGDVILLCGGGHGLEMLAETDILEVKQGPYVGDTDKVRF